MASLIKDKNGTRRLEFADRQKKRRRLFLGKVTKREGETIQRFVERLVSSQISGQSYDNEVAEWISSRPDDFYKKLARFGLVQERKTGRLGEFVQSYIDERTDVKPRTTQSYIRVQNYLIKFFGDEKQIRDITEGDAKRFATYLNSEGLASASRSKYLQTTKQFFESAIRNKIVGGNPFKYIKCPQEANEERRHFVTVDEIERVLESCPDNDWRLIWLLARFGGMRCPSEVLHLKWSGIDWAKKRMTILDIKNQRYTSKKFRTIPIFPEIEPALQIAWDQATEGSEFVIARYKAEVNENLRKTAGSIMQSAGVHWEKPFQNCRSTRETELANQYPIHVVCKWMGNSIKTAQKHYLQMTEDHFETATNKQAQNQAQSVLDRVVNAATENQRNPIKNGQQVTRSDTDCPKSRRDRNRDG